MSAENRAFVLSVFRELGRRDAAELRQRAGGMEKSDLLAEEAKIPLWEEEREYSLCPAGTPVRFAGAVYRLAVPSGAVIGRSPAELADVWEAV